MANYPPMTVAVVTQRNRYDSLVKLMKSIEIAIVDYPAKISLMLIGSVIDQLVKTVQCEFTNLHIVGISSNGKVPTGRQLAVNHCTTNLLVFVDDDCEVDSEIFREYANTLSSNSHKKIGAIYGLTRFSGADSASFKACRYTPFVHPFQIATLYDEVEWAPTSNAIFSKEAVETIGGFDLSIPVEVSGEDVDIGIRLKKAGFSCLTCSRSLVYHTTVTWNKFNTNIKRFLTYGRSEAWLTVKYATRRKISWGTMIVLISILLASFAVYSFGLWGFLFLPYIFLGWLLYRIITWFALSVRIPLLSYVISDLYKLADYVGYIYQTFRLGIGSWGNVFLRFKFYKCDYIQERIKEEGLH